MADRTWGMGHLWGTGVRVGSLLIVLGACSGIEPAPAPPDETAGEGGASIAAHGNAACANLGGSSGAGAGGSAPGTSSGGLPSDFGTGGKNQGGESSGGTNTSSSSGASGGEGASPGQGGASPGAGGAPPEPLGHAFLFSEYVEGSSSFKALEITALETSTFEGCRIATYFNGASSASGFELEGLIEQGQSYSLCSKSLAELGAHCDRIASLSFNGDDAIALECDGVNVDVIGQVGVDPGNAWGSGDVSTLDHTLRRKCSVDLGDALSSDTFEPSLEWAGVVQDSFDDLGLHDCASDGSAGAGSE